MDQGQKKTKKVNKPLSGALIAAGLFFMINPNVSVIDVLPDFIGALLILFGFLHFADIDERAMRARKALGIFAAVNAAKCLSILLLLDADGTVWSLIFTFVFGGAEAALFAYGMCTLFAGITYRAQRLDCPPMLRGFSALNGMTILVAVLKNLLVILPELTKLTSDYGDVNFGAVGAGGTAHFIYTALTIFNIAVVTLYGIGWWVYTLRYFRALDRQNGFLEKLQEQYVSEVGSKPQVRTYRALKTAGVLSFAALVFLLPLHLDGIDYLPDYVAGALFALALLRMRALYPRETRRALIPCAL